ncbi:hypothetical protein [Lacihabitans sp. LS3-19]|uniref:hypothetical protein n=1 Tax=Lacihabitans sp. LS3-19 TaxID=2487335 RepID=UPI0020CF3C7E|nr:hypothetical protein [Lacihabitans sp. LS3-19]
MLAIIFQILLLVACQSEDGLVEPVSLTGKVQKLGFFTGNTEERSYNFGYNVKGELTTINIVTNGNTSAYKPVLDSSGKLIYLVFTATKDSTKYTYNAKGLLKEIQASQGRKETFEYDKNNQLTYYTKQTLKDGSIVYDEVRSNKWQGNLLISQITSVPGKSYEEEAMTYTTEINPLKTLFETELQAVPMLEPFGMCAMMPKTSMRLYGGLNLKFEAKYDEGKKLTELQLKEETINGLNAYKQIVITYFP